MTLNILGEGIKIGMNDSWSLKWQACLIVLLIWNLPHCLMCTHKLFPLCQVLCTWGQIWGLDRCKGCYPSAWHIPLPQNTRQSETVTARKKTIINGSRNTFTLNFRTSNTHLQLMGINCLRSFFVKNPDSSPVSISGSSNNYQGALPGLSHRHGVTYNYIDKQSKRIAELQRHTQTSTCTLTKITVRLHIFRRICWRGTAVSSVASLPSICTNNTKLISLQSTQKCKEPQHLKYKHCA